MTSSSRPSKKHHFVPQAQLRHFAADVEQRFLFVFAKQSDRSFRASILNAGSENDFNTVSLGDSKWNFEDLFQDVDARSARLVAEITSRRSVAWLMPEDRVAVVDLFATQLLRTHFSRSTPRRIAERLRETTREFGYDPDQLPGMAVPSDAALRLGAARAFMDRGEHAAALLRLVPALYTTSGEQPFIISDHPITISNAFPYGNQGLSSQGILVYLPISPDLTITLHCPTIVQRYELAAHADIEAGRKARMLRYLDGLQSGEPIEIDDSTGLALNLDQVAQSRSYLYAATDTFDFAREFLREHPEHGAVESHIGMGEMGCGPPPRQGMPAGTHLVIFGLNDHCMLSIEEVDDAGEGLTARTREMDLLAQVAADRGMLQTELYVDGQLRRAIGQAMIERIGDPPGGWFRVVHRDPSLRALGVCVDKKRG